MHVSEEIRCSLLKDNLDFFRAMQNHLSLEVDLKPYGIMITSDKLRY